jgi:hypothetical protein
MVGMTGGTYYAERTPAGDTAQDWLQQFDPSYIESKNG